MDTIHQQHKLACEEALRLYASIEAAIEDRRTGFANEEAKNLRALLKNRGRSSVFEEAAASLPQEVTPNLRAWSAEAAYSKSKIEDYLAELEHGVLQEGVKTRACVSQIVHYSGMSKVKVYRVKAYDVSTDQQVESRRMATREGAAAMHGMIIESTETEIDDAQLEPGEQWTPIDFKP
jgi:hypothetical protein